MRTIKKVASHIFIDGFGGMTAGSFCNLDYWYDDSADSVF